MTNQRYRLSTKLVQRVLSRCFTLGMLLTVGVAAVRADANTLRPPGPIVWHITNCADSGAGTLRERVESGDAHSGDTIDISECSEIQLASALTIEQNTLTLIGEDPLLNTISGGGSGGVLRHIGVGELKIESMTVWNGFVEGASTGTVRGGCVYSAGKVHVFDVVVDTCVANNVGAGAAEGGAIFAAQGVLLEFSKVLGSVAQAANGHARGGGVFSSGYFDCFYSTVDGNRAIGLVFPSSGGGAYATGGGYVLKSTISWNTADIVGGLLLVSLSDEMIEINTSTISRNTSLGMALAAGAYLAFPGGGADQHIEVTDSTITANINHYHSAAGLWMSNHCSTVCGTHLGRTIVSGNWYFDGTDYLPSDLGSDTGIYGFHSLVGTAESGFESGPVETIQQIDTQLGPLVDNGGFTKTHAIGTGSWAFNMGTPGDFDDQRDMPRDVGTGQDIGAFESDALFIGRFEAPPLFIPSVSIIAPD